MSKACLGTHVWRRLDGRDALFQDCIAPSCYSKAQGKAIRVWGMLALGRLHIHVLEATACGTLLRNLAAAAPEISYQAQSHTCVVVASHDLPFPKLSCLLLQIPKIMGRALHMVS